MGMKRRQAARPITGASVSGFAEIYDRAAGRKGGPDALEALLPSAPNNKALRRTSDDRFLSAMAQGIFKAGFVWKVVERKWPDFEQAFAGFDVAHVAGLDDGDIDDLAGDARIIRNRPKIVAVVDNARFVLDMSSAFGGFGNWLANWPEDNIVGLWTVMANSGSRLGGFTGPLFLRVVGKDSPLLSGDVVKALIGAGVITKKPTAQRDLRAVQEALNTWCRETGRPMCQLSRILACSVD